MPTLLRREAKRIAQHVGKIVTHEQRLVLVHRQPRLSLAARQLQPDAPARHAVPLHQLDDLIVDTQPRILQVDRVDRMIRDRHVDAQALDLLLAVEADDAGQATARTAVGDAVQIDEADALLRPVDVGDAGAQASGHESKMRIGIARLDGTLLRRQILASMELVVLVAGALGKHGAEDFNVRGNGVCLARQPRRQALFEIAGRRVERVIEVVG